MEYPDREEEELSVLNKDKYYALTEKSFYKKLGKVTKIVGLTIESAGPDAKLTCVRYIRLIKVRFFMQR